MWLLWHFHEKISSIWIACNYKERTLIHFLSLLRSRVIVWCRWGGVLCCYYTHRADRQYWYTLIEAVYHNTAQLHCWPRSPRGWRCLLCISYEGSVFVHKSPVWITMLEHSPSSDFISRLMTSSPSNFISPQHYSAFVFFFCFFFLSLIDEVLQNCGQCVWGTFVKWGITSPAFPGDGMNSLSCWIRADCLSLFFHFMYLVSLHTHGAASISISPRLPLRSWFHLVVWASKFILCKCKKYKLLLFILYQLWKNTF